TFLDSGNVRRAFDPYRKVGVMQPVGTEGGFADDLTHVVALDDAEIFGDSERNVGAGTRKSAAAGGNRFGVDNADDSERYARRNDGEARERIIGGRGTIAFIGGGRACRQRF